MNKMQKWIPKNLKELSQLANQLQAEAKPDLPAFALVKKRFKDTTANDLTKTIIFDMHHIREGVAYRINNGAIYDVKRQTYGIEVKIGRDRQSADQKEVEREITEAGGVYFIAKSYDDYLEKISMT